MASIALTRRGRVAGVVGLAAAVSAVVAGGRALGAVTVPVAVALVAGYLQASRAEVPRTRRVTPADGFVGETAEVRIEFGDGDDVDANQSFPATVRDRLGDGLAGPPDPVRAAVGTEPVSYLVEYRGRGDRTFGPIEVTATDVFGLFERTIVVDETDSVTVYPPRDPVPARFRRELCGADAAGASQQREAFDRLREYTRGDALRDVHWATTATRDEVVVKEFAADTALDRVSIVGRTDADGSAEQADALARATVGLALGLLDDGVPVEVRLPVGSAAAAPGGRGRRAVLELAARTGPGTVDGREADATVVAGSDAVRVRTGGRTVRFDDLRREADAERDCLDTLRSTAPGRGGSEDGRPADQTGVNAG